METLSDHGVIGYYTAIFLREVHHTGDMVDLCGDFSSHHEADYLLLNHLHRIRPETHLRSDLRQRYHTINLSQGFQTMKHQGIYHYNIVRW